MIIRPKCVQSIQVVLCLLVPICDAFNRGRVPFVKYDRTMDLFLIFIHIKGSSNYYKKRCFNY